VFSTSIKPSRLAPLFMKPSLLAALHPSQCRHSPEPEN
jgi:hypothetical protein